MTAQSPDAFPPVERLDGDTACGILVLCDHASNALPPEYGTLGLDPSQLERHIGYDIGAAAVTRGLARRLGAPALLTTYSRLLIDPNRGDDDPTLIMRLSDGAVVPANARHTAEEREARIARFHRPYHAAIKAELDFMEALGLVPLIVSIHSFTPVWRGTPRPWHVGMLWDTDPRAAITMIRAFERDPTLVVGDNEPYDGALRNDTLYVHGSARGFPHVLVEVRQDLIADDAGAEAWAARLEPITRELRADPEMGTVRRYGSRAGALPVDA